MVIAAAAAALAQDTLTNADVLKLVKAGLSEQFVLRNINEQSSSFVTEVGNLVELKQANVSERVISAMVKKNPPREGVNSEGIIRLAKSGYSDSFLQELIKSNPSKFRTGTDRIVELKSAGVSEAVIAAMMAHHGGEPVSLPSGTQISIRLIDDIDSEKHAPGARFRASVDEPVLVDGKEVVARGADATVVLVDEQSAGRVSGRTQLTISLASVRGQDGDIPVNSSSVSQTSGSRGAKTAKTAAGVGAVGAIIGAIAGGGKGAAIGAASGAAVGAGAVVLMKGERVRLPSETLLTFTAN
jgi:hypothetical protein